jgi:hypothetical protein
MSDLAVNNDFPESVISETTDGEVVIEKIELDMVTDLAKNKVNVC